MAEAIRGGSDFVRSESGLMVPEERKEINKRIVIETLGEDYKHFVQDLVAQLGGLPVGCKVTVFDEPDQHVYKIIRDGKEVEIVSGSINLVEEHVGRDLIIVPLLRKGEKSSHHFHDYHPNGGEEYRSMIGLVRVYMDGEPFVLDQKNNSILVPLNVNHQVEAITDFAVPFIRMRNTKGIPRERLHTLVG